MTDPRPSSRDGPLRPVRGDSTRPPPASVEAEQSLLGAVMLDNAVIAAVSHVEAQYFYRQDHRLIWTAILSLLGRSEPADAITVWADLEASGNGESAGGFSYLIDIANNTASARNAAGYARIIIDRWIERQMMSVASAITETATATAVDVEAKIAEVKRLLGDVIGHERMRSGGDNMAILPANDFIDDDKPADWVIHGLLQREYLYALTGPTNAGKTAISQVLALSVATGRKIARFDVTKGKVLILCGENESGFRSRLSATMHAYGISPTDTADTLFIFPRAMALRDCVEPLRIRMQGHDLALVIIDTSVAYFSGDKEDDNIQSLEHAMLMRRINKWRGGPAVVANCHPTKNPDRENNVPRGGSAFLNEIDANLTVWESGGRVEMHWQRKKRGPDFDPVDWEIVQAEHGGNDVVVARVISETRSRELATAITQDENKVLWAMLHHPKGSMADLASACGWSNKGAKVKVYRLLARLMSDRLVAKNRNGYYLTQKGKDEAGRIN